MEALQIPARQEYVPYFRLSESVLGELLPRLSDEEITQLVSSLNWVALPLPGEQTKEEIENRSGPHIDFRLTESSMRIGLRCNTVPSVDKLRNILQECHTSEKSSLVSGMGQLDDDFQTTVYAKIKEHNWSERGEYLVRFQRQTNKIDAAGFDEMFAISDQIRAEGKGRQKEEKLPHNPVTPVIDIAYTTIGRGDDQLFNSKISQLKPLYETCLKVKTDSMIRTEERLKKTKTSTKTTAFECSKCRKRYSKEEARELKWFCNVDRMRIRTVFV
jgi:hypothetical protein